MSKNKISVLEKVFPLKRRTTVFVILSILLISWITWQIYTVSYSEYYRLSQDFIIKNSKVNKFIGKIKDLRLSLINNEARMQYPLKHSTAKLIFIIEGDKSAGNIYINLEVPYEEWEIINAKLVLDSGKEVNLLE